jgi:hypothetical protein
MVYVLKGGQLKLTSADKTDELDLSEGGFLNAQNHESTNTGNSTVDLLVVEFKK